MAALLQRRPAGTDVITSLGAPGEKADYTRQRSGSVTPLYADVATIAQANKLRDVSGTSEKDITLVHDAKVGEKNVMPGLNFAQTLSGRGETGFVDATGIYRGSQLPVTLDGPLPRVAISLTSAAFEHGKDHALATMRHEMEHAAHMQMLVDWLEKWRKSVKAKSATSALSDTASRSVFDKWIAAQKGISGVDRALIKGDKATDWENTEVLAYTEGFMTAFHLGAQQPSLSLAIEYPGAIEQLWGLAKRFDSADKDIKDAALARIREYHDKVLDAKQKGAFRDWLQFLIDLAKETPSSLGGDDLRAAKKVRSDFGSYADFLTRVLRRKSRGSYAHSVAKSASSPTGRPSSGPPAVVAVSRAH